MPARALEVPHQRHDRRQHREDEQLFATPSICGWMPEPDLQVERDDLQVVHQRAAFPLAVPLQERRVVDEAPGEEHAVDLHEERDERAEGTLEVGRAPADAGQRLVEEDAGQDELREMSGGRRRRSRGATRASRRTATPGTITPMMARLFLFSRNSHAR